MTHGGGTPAVWNPAPASGVRGSVKPPGATKAGGNPVQPGRNFTAPTGETGWIWGQPGQQNLIDLLAGGRNETRTRSLGTGQPAAAAQPQKTMPTSTAAPYAAINRYRDLVAEQQRKMNAELSIPHSTPHYPTHSLGETQAVAAYTKSQRDNEIRSRYRNTFENHFSPGEWSAIQEWRATGNMPQSQSSGGGGAGQMPTGPVGQVETTINAQQPLYDRNITQRFVNSQVGQALSGSDPRYLMHAQGTQRPGVSLDEGSLAEVSPAMAQSRAAVSQAQGLIPLMDELANRNFMLGGQQAQANESNQLASLLAGMQDLGDYRTSADQQGQMSQLLQLLSMLG